MNKDTKEIPEKFTNLRDIRNSHGWTQQQMASALGVSKSLVCMMESGERSVTPEMRRKIEATVQRLESMREERRDRVRAAVMAVFNKPHLAAMRRRHGLGE